MTLKEQIQNVNSIFFLENDLIVLSKKEAVNLNTKKSISIKAIGNVRKNKSILASILVGKVELYDSDLKIIGVVENEAISYDSGLTLFDKDNFILHNFLTSDNLLYFENSRLSGRVNDFWGGVLNSKYILHYPNGIFNNPIHFRCSNILDTETYWEYDCGEGEQVKGSFILYQDKLIFYTKERSVDDYLSRLWVNVLDINTGLQIFKLESKNYGACFDSETGKFVAVSGSSQYAYKYKFYEIIDINIGTVVIENIENSESFFAVGTSMQHINDGKLYFIDNFVTIGGIKHNETPKIGCFDFLKTELIYFKEIPDFKNKTVAQILCSNSTIFIRTQNFELYVFEDIY